ncbi:MAG TPA: hypothetical protein VG735_06830 [Caulobacterales bacterium]|jgi:predicted transcriptional regulator|nr:hypothetical protein [Caulobacterales bacterium]
MTDLTIVIDAATEFALERVAEATKRPKAEVAAEALASHLRDQADLEAMVLEAREDFAAGCTFSADQVAESARAIIEAARARKA